jgi:hypothetical protein
MFEINLSLYMYKLDVNLSNRKTVETEATKQLSPRTGQTTGVSCSENVTLLPHYSNP